MIGKYIPKTEITNKWLSKKLGQTEEWIYDRCKIKTRHWVLDESVTDMAVLASEEALRNSDIKPSDLDLIVCNTIESQFVFPGCSQQVHGYFKLDTNIPSFDMNVGCSGFVYGLHIIDKLPYEKVLFVCSELQSTFLSVSPSGRDSSILMGDGAGAIVWDKKNGFKLIDSIVFSDGRKVDKLYGSRKYSPHMDGGVVFKNAVSRMREMVEEIFSRNKISLEDIKYIIPHQANGRIVDHLSRSFKTNKIFSNIEKYGNTTSATIPIALSEVDLKKGDKVILVSFGTGFTWGACLIEW
jgi:3-oxoacyl-[acyl-carrier-protein] synthase III